MIADEKSVLGNIEWPKESNKMPREIFRNPDLYELELERIFHGPTWHIVAQEAEIPEPGDFKATSIGNVPVIASRDKQGEIHVLVNSCAHRSNQVEMDSCGNTNLFTCIYHHWTYKLDGRLNSCSMPEDYPQDFREEDYGLTKLHVDTCSGVIFASFSDDALPLREYLGGLTERIEEAFPGKMKLLGSQKFMLDCNWKMYAENFYDGYHAVILHKAFKVMQLRGGGGTYFDPESKAPYHSNLRIYGKDPTEESKEKIHDISVFETRSKEKNEDDNYSNLLLHVFPLGAINDQFDLKTIRRAIPHGVDKTEIQLTYFAIEGESEDLVRQRIRQGSNLYGPSGMVTLEDGVVFESMQRASTARGSHVWLKGTVKQNPPYRMVDEAALQSFYQGYRDLMGV